MLQRQRLLRFITALMVIYALASVQAATGADQSDGIDFSTIREYAVLANAAYHTPDEITGLLANTGYTLTDHGIIPEVEIAWLLLTSPDTRNQVIAVRGTSNINNALVDVELKLVPDAHAGARMHSGFARAAEALYGEVRNRVRKDYRLSTTGHSLGGAVAVILGLYLDMDGLNVEQVVTFGQPKVTNVSGSSKFDRLDILRIVTPKDVVPLVPPLDAVDINDLDIYWHAGREIILMENARYAVLEGVNSMLRATRFTQQQPDENNLKQHRMSHYLRLLDDKTANAERVPFKNSLNLFNLFGGDSE